MFIRAFERRQMRRAWPVYFANLFFSLSYAAVLYINSSFLGQYFSAAGISLLFALAALCTIVLFLLAPALLRHVGNKGAFVFYLILQLGGLGALITAGSALAAALGFVVYASTTLLVFYCLDIFIEDISEDESTGEIRGITLTIDNFAIACAPLLFGALTLSGSFAPVYAASALFLLPVLALGLFGFKKFKDAREHGRYRVLPIKAWWQRLEARRATEARFVLEFFYGVMVIFMAPYLHRVVGFDWQTIGTIFFIMLLPFVLFELPAGELADHWCGERELSTVGFFIMGTATLLIPFLGANPVLWMAALFLSRIGAALVEITSEAHFFRHVDKSHAGIISIFRLARPIAILASALFGAMLVYAFSYQKLFFALAILVFAGMFESAKLVDTK